MSTVFNPFTGNFDFTGNSQWKTPVTNQASLPASGNSSGDVRVALDTGIAYEWSGASWSILNGVFPTAVSGTSTPDGVSVDGSNNLTLHVADATNPGLLSTTTQTIAGNKTLTGTTNLSSLTASTALTLDPSKNITSSATTSAELAFVHGVTSAIQTQLDATEKTANKGVANGYAALDAGAKVPYSQLPSALMTFKGAWDASTNTPTLVDGTGLAGDTYRVSVAGTQNLGSGNQTFFVGDFVIYNGTIWQRSPAADGVISVNGAQGAVTVNAINQLTGDVTAGPASGSASASSTIQTNVVSNSKLAQMAANTVKANVTGSTANASDVALGTTTESTSSVLTLTGWTDATIGSPTIQVKQSTTTQSGYLSSTDWNTFNNKQTAGNYITALTGDAAASGPGSAALTLATVNANTGSFGTASSTGTFTVNGKGLITAASSTSIQISESQVTNLVTDLASKVSINVGDIAETPFSAANNVSVAANVTGLLFPSASVGSFRAQVQVNVNATTPLRQMFTIQGSQTGAGGWTINSTSVGDETGFLFTINSSGQILYTNNNYTGFVSATLKFRAWGVSL